MGDAELDRPETWFSILPGQYRNFEKWRDGDYEPGEEGEIPSLRKSGSRKIRSWLCSARRWNRARAELSTPASKMTYIAADPALCRGLPDQFREV